MRAGRKGRGASFVEAVVLMGIVALGCAVAFVAFGGAIRQGAACQASRLLGWGLASSCGAVSPVHASPAAGQPTSSPDEGVEAASFCVGGQCRGGNCFAAGTPVLTDSGPRPIEDLGPGDRVLSRDVETGTERVAIVAARKVTKDRTTMLVGVGDARPIEVTSEHRFWTEEHGWVPAGALAVGMHLSGAGGLAQGVRSLATSATVRDVYNIEVEGTHTYFAGSGAVLVHNDCDPLVAATFTVRDLESAGVPVRDRLLVAYYWVRLPNPEREHLNRVLREERLRGDDRVGRYLVSAARSAYPGGLPREMDTGVGAGSVEGSLVVQEMRFQADLQRVNAEREEQRAAMWRVGLGQMRRPADLRLALAGRRDGLSELFFAPQTKEKDPRAAMRNPLAGEWMISHDTDIRLIADAILEESGVETRARFERPDTSWSRWLKEGIREHGKAALWRAGGALIAPDSLKAAPTEEEKFRQRLTQDAFDFAAGVELSRTPAGGVVLKPIDTPESVAAIRTLLVPQNFALLDVAAAAARGEIALPDGRVTSADFEAMASGARYPEDLRRAAAHFTNPAIQDDRVRRPTALTDRFWKLDARDGLVDGVAFESGFRALLAEREAGRNFTLAPSLHRIFVREGNGRDSTAVDIIDWSETIGTLHEAELAWLTGLMSTRDFDHTYNVEIAGNAKQAAALARQRLDADLDALTSHGLDGVLAPDFEKDMGAVITLGQLGGKYDAYLNRAWYERLGVGTWSAVKEVLMVPVGLGELIVYAGDHVNPVVLVKGRPDGAPLLHVFIGKGLTNPIGAMDGMSQAFDDWWLSAQASPDAAVGQGVGLVATFFIPFDKVVKVARVSGSIGRALALAAEARAAGDLARADRLLARAKQMTRLLGRIRDAERVGQGLKGGAPVVATEAALKQQVALDELVATTERAVAKAEGALAGAATEGAKPVASAALAGKVATDTAAIALLDDVTRSISDAGPVLDELRKGATAGHAADAKAAVDLSLASRMADQRLARAKALRDQADGLLRRPSPTGKEALEARRHLAEASRLVRDAESLAEVRTGARTAMQRLTGGVERSGNEVTLLFDGVESFARRERLIGSAKKSIELQTFILRDDATGWALARQLVAKSKEGVKVRVIYDQLGSGSLGKEMVQFMEKGGVEVRGYGHLVKEPWRLNTRWHQKHLVVDGKSAIEGGMNIGDEYALGGTAEKVVQGKKVSDPFRDTDILIEGPTVSDIRARFDDNWRKVGGTVAAEDAAKASDVRPTAPGLGKKVRFVASEAGHTEEVTSLYVEAINSATKSITIENAYLLPPPEVRAALVAAAKRGVDVRIMANSHLSTTGHNWIASFTARAFYDDMLEAGVRIFERDGGGLLHSKTATFDGDYSIIGSHNLNGRSLFLDSESVLAVRDAQTAKALRHRFDTGLGATTEITPKTLETTRARLRTAQRMLSALAWMF